MGQEVGEWRGGERRRQWDELEDLVRDHIAEDRRQFAEILVEIKEGREETKKAIAELKASVSGVVSLFGHSKWLVKCIIALGGLATFIITIWYMLAAIKAGGPPQ